MGAPGLPDIQTPINPCHRIRRIPVRRAPLGALGLLVDARFVSWTPVSRIACIALAATGPVDFQRRNRTATYVFLPHTLSMHVEFI